jgi:hypothetical protein
MAHFAKVVNGIVEQVIVADTAEWCKANLGGEWVQTSYNTHGGVHKDGKFPIHKNYAGIGYTFDGVGFATPQPYASWVLNEESYLWEAPTPKPEDGKIYEWNETDLAWEEVILPTE